MALKEDYKDAVFAGLRKYKMLDNGDGTVSPVDMTEYEAAGDKFGAKDVNAITKTVNATGEIIADDNDGFKPDQKYVIGDIVIYDNKTWRFKVDHEPGEWDESQVERTNILAVIAEQNKNFGGLTFAKDESGAWGYRVGGADPVIPFKTLDIVYVGTITSSGSINVMSKCPNYKKMTAGDFLLDYQSMAVRLWDGKIGGSTINVSKSYNSSTGVLTLSNLSASSSTSYVRCTVGVYAKVK